MLTKMALFTRQKRPRPPRSTSALTAATLQVGGAATPAEQRRTRTENWQRRAWELYDEIGEVRFAARYMGDAQARLDLFVGIRPQPKDNPVPLEDMGDRELGYTAAEKEAADDALERLRSPLGGRREIQRALGVHLFLPGECYLVGEPDPPDYPDLEERWDVYSIDEVQIDPDTKEITLRDPTGSTFGGGRKLPRDAVAYRIWRPHPRYSSWADSPLRSAISILEELSVLTRAINAAATSRLKGPGVLFLPNSLRAGSSTIVEGDGQATTEDRLIRDFITAAGTAIRDPASSFAHVPLVVWMSDDQWSNMGPDKLLRWDQGVDEIMAKLRAELIQRFATAIDLPPEVLTGKGGLNHWSAWLISDEAFRNHIEPMAMLIVDALTVNYLRPALAEAGVPDPERFEVWYDAASLVSDPDSGARALDAFDRGLISASAARRELGFSESDADADEHEVQLPPPGDVPEPEDREEPPPPERGPPEQDKPQPHDPVASVTAGLVEQIRERRAAHLTQRFGLADLALLRDLQLRCDAVLRRALEKANARLRSLAARDATARALLRDVPSGSLLEAPTLGWQMMRRLTAAETDEAATEVLVGAALESVDPWYEERLAGEAEVMLGSVSLSDSQRAQARERFAADRQAAREVLLGGLIGLAGMLLSRPDVEEALGETDGSLTPTGIVRDALRVAGGGGEKAASLYTGAHVGELMREGGYAVGGWQWVYGPHAWRKRPFQPHLALDGIVFSDPDDERLGNPTLGWPGVSAYWPGDHPGCMCTVVRVWEAVPSNCVPRPTVGSMCPDELHDVLMQAQPEVDWFTEDDIQAYMDAGSRLLNDALRRHRGRVQRIKDPMLRRMHDSLTAITVPSPVHFTAWRAVPARVLRAVEEGDELVDYGWLSATIYEDDLDAVVESLIESQLIRRGEPIVLYEIGIPAGQPVAYLGHNPFYEREKGEVVLPPGTVHEVLAIDELIDELILRSGERVEVKATVWSQPIRTLYLDR